jgi:hypothetical protein
VAARRRASSSSRGVTALPRWAWLFEHPLGCTAADLCGTACSPCERQVLSGRQLGCAGRSRHTHMHAPALSAAGCTGRGSAGPHVTQAGASLAAPPWR